MEIVIIILLVSLMFFLLYKEFNKKEDRAVIENFASLKAHFESLKHDFQGFNTTLDRKMGETQTAFQRQFAQTARIVEDVTKELTSLKSTNQQIVGFADQMKTLENILKNPKQRGILGEFFLENILGQTLPPDSYKMQYSFKNGTIVDAAIFVKNKIIPVDAKFTLENYNRMMEENDATKRDELEKEMKRDIKLRIDETAKYVIPEEDTLEFALMFIPADGIFYSLLTQKVGTMDINSQDLIQYAFSKKVIIVSPMTFFAYLQTIMQALRNLQIEETVVDVIKNVKKLQNHLGAYDEYMRKVGNNLSTTVNIYNTAYKEFGKIDKDVMKITGEYNKIDILDVPKPDNNN
jgi:DNA recombination protein RmuC